MRSTTLLRGIIPAALVVLASCESPWAVEVESPIPEAPEEYYLWYTQVADCMGISAVATPARFAQIDWYTAVDIYNPSQGVRALGLWTEPHRITVRSDRLMDPVVVKHELVHDLLGDGQHPAPFFQACAGL